MNYRIRPGMPDFHPAQEMRNAPRGIRRIPRGIRRIIILMIGTMLSFILIGMIGGGISAIVEKANESSDCR